MPKDDYGLRELTKSREHWERLLKCRSHEEFLSEGWTTDSCALCRKFNTMDNPCEGCPIRLETGEPYCWGTPYDKASTILDAVIHSRKHPDTLKCMSLRVSLRGMVQFLRKLETKLMKARELE